MNSEIKRTSALGKIIAWTIPLILIGIVTFIATMSNDESEATLPKAERKLPNVEVSTVATTAFDEELVLPARVEASRSAILAAEFGGKVGRWLVEEGARVKAGAPIVELDTATIKASLAEARSASASAEAALGGSRASSDRAKASLAKTRRDAEAVDLDLASAESALKLAQADYNRSEELVKQGVATKASLDRESDALTQARLGVDRAKDVKERAELAVEVALASANEAEASVAIARARIGEVETSISSLEVRLAKHTIRAPFSGVIDEHLVETGEVISTGQRLTDLYDFSTVKAKASIPDRYVPFFDVDNPTLAQYLTLHQTGAVSKLTAKLVIPGLPKLTGGKENGLELPASIGRVARASDPTSNTFEVELEADNPGGALRQGMIAEGHIGFLHYEEAVIIPISAIQVTDEGPRVMVVEGSGAARTVTARAVEPLSISGDDVHIGAGLAPGEKLVTRGWKGIVPGEKVKVIMEDGVLFSGNTGDSAL